MFCRCLNLVGFSSPPIVFCSPLIFSRRFYHVETSKECSNHLLLNIFLSDLRRALSGCISPLQSSKLLDVLLFCCIRASSLLFVAPCKGFHFFFNSSLSICKDRARALSPARLPFSRSHVPVQVLGADLLQEPALSRK